jgi:hypothetical protein
MTKNVWNGSSKDIYIHVTTPPTIVRRLELRKAIEAKSFSRAMIRDLRV